MESAALDAAAITQGLQQLPGWTYADHQLQRTYRFDSFRTAMSFLVRLSYEAEELNHHPHLTHVYHTVTLRLCTHDAGDRVTQKDFALAAACQRLAGQFQA